MYTCIFLYIYLVSEEKKHFYMFSLGFRFRPFPENWWTIGKSTVEHQAAPGPHAATKTSNKNCRKLVKRTGGTNVESQSKTGCWSPRPFEPDYSKSIVRRKPQDNQYKTV